MVFDIARARGLYTSLGDGWTYLNADSRPQIPESVSASVARSFRNAPVFDRIDRAGETSGSHSQRGLAGQVAGDGYVASARRAIAELTGTSPDAVILGPSVEVLYSRLALALRPLMRSDTEIVNSHADTLRIDPVTVGAAVEKLAEPDLGTGETPAWQYSGLVNGATRLVSVSAAHRFVGSTNRIAEIADIVHSRSRAWLLVDATALAGIRSVNIGDMGADIVAVDCAAFGGPDISALAFRDATMFPRMDSKFLELSVAPGLAGGVSAAVDHLADMSDGIRGTRRKRLGVSLVEASEYLTDLGLYLVDSLSSLPTVHIFGITGEVAEDAHVDRIPRFTFCIEGVPAETIYQRLIANRLVTTITPTTDPLLNAMGMGDTQGAISIGLAVYNTPYDVDQFVRVVASLA